jgi:hypothetical protein
MHNMSRRSFQKYVLWSLHTAYLQNFLGMCLYICALWEGKKQGLVESLLPTTKKRLYHPGNLFYNFKKCASDRVKNISMSKLIYVSATIKDSLTVSTDLCFLRSRLNLVKIHMGNQLSSVQKVSKIINCEDKSSFICIK